MIRIDLCQSDLTGGVAFAQPPATTLNPYRMKPDDIKAEETLIGQKDRTQKNESYIFLRSIFLPIQVITATVQRPFRSQPKNASCEDIASKSSPCIPKGVTDCSRGLSASETHRVLTSPRVGSC